MKKTFKRVVVIALAVMLLMSVVAPAFAAGVTESMYYQISNLTSKEKSALKGLKVGTVIVMYPKNNKYYSGSAAEELVTNGTVKIICMPGVGSSSLSAAAMARQIAKAKNQPVAAITVGLGDASVMYESVQGYFVGRANNVAGTTYTDTASSKLVKLYKNGARPTLLVGHSKGNMDIANALFKMYNDGHKSWYKGVTFKTFGCGVNVPSGVTLKQYIGTLDSLGYLNTVSWKNMTYVAGRYHTLNPAYAATYMPIQKYV